MSRSRDERNVDARAADGARTRALVARWVAVVLSALVFAVFGYLVAERRPMPFDASMLAWFHGHAAPWRTSVARGLTAIGEPTVVGPLTLVVVLALVAMRLWRQALLMTLQVGGAAALDEGFKLVFARPRPTLYPHLVHETTFSFPSGHAVGDLAFALACYFVLRSLLPAGWRWLGRSLGVVLVALALVIAATRPYLQVHYPSDVLAGWALALAWVLAVEVLLAERLGHRGAQVASG